ncbi:uncharacterized protein LOC132037947 isoform X8 [Lycium ferocissimum]|uniref:uncharacterized protein LOC132037947 isoform X8 n=1 Tax=Lycium ferocissimum TaxID=112874 RepID=UPI00281620F0|nr:uncharacterized protein LOC132037947 isoform X8 [Lycium ferocissimum]
MAVASLNSFSEEHLDKVIEVSFMKKIHGHSCSENSGAFTATYNVFFVSIIFCAGSGIIQERECRVTLELDHDIDARSSCLPGDNEKIFEEVDGTCWLQVFRISIESLFLQSVCTF